MSLNRDCTVIKTGFPCAYFFTWKILFSLHVFSFNYRDLCTCLPSFFPIQDFTVGTTSKTWFKRNLNMQISTAILYRVKQGQGAYRKTFYRGSPHSVISQFVISYILWFCFRPQFCDFEEKKYFWNFFWI